MPMTARVGIAKGDQTAAAGEPSTASRRLRVMIHRTKAFRTLVICCCVMGLGGCADVTSVAGQPKASVSSPKLPTSYDYVLKSSCGERGFLGAYRVSVRDTKATAVTSLTPDHAYQPSLDEVPTLVRLLERADAANPEAVVDLQVDEAGIPISLVIDHKPTAIDDEECYQVSELEVVQP